MLCLDGKVIITQTEYMLVRILIFDVSSIWVWEWKEIMNIAFETEQSLIIKCEHQHINNSISNQNLNILLCFFHKFWNTITVVCNMHKDS
jgi:hypothetical protein